MQFKAKGVTFPVTMLFVLALLNGVRTGFTRAGSVDRLKTKGASPLIGGQFNYLPIVRTAFSAVPLIHIPFIDDIFDENFQFRTGFSETAIFWFGQITPSDNYADVRVGYNATDLFVRVAIFDRRLWYDKTPSADVLENWDAATLLLDLDGAVGTAPDQNSFRFIAQLNKGQSRAAWERVDRGQSGIWQSSDLPFSTLTAWRGNSPNDNLNDKGWRADFVVPFSSLGLAGPPSEGTRWGLGIVMHDNDDGQGPTLPDKAWPADTLNPDRPDTWGQVSFGLPHYQSPAAKSPTTIVIRQGLNGIQVTDVAAGGHSICGGALEIWNEWGQANYDGYAQANIQNQRDLADWPCFSKFFITFPINSIPADKIILSATLTMEQFGSAGQGLSPPAQPSLIQVFTVADNWSETSLTWNNAPQVLENVARTWVDPLPAGGPPVIRSWDLTAAVAEALTRGGPLRLALYSADSPYHSGRYFTTSDVGDWNAENRPALTITFDDP